MFDLKVTYSYPQNLFLRVSTKLESFKKDAPMNLLLQGSEVFNLNFKPNNKQSL